MKPHLISFKTCPFVRRSVIVLLKKKIDFDVSYVDLANKPDWFLKVSPTGKVPVLQVGEDIIFESAVINEYLDEVYPPSLHPHDPLVKAKNRAWIEFSSTLFMDLWVLSSTDNKLTFDSRLEVVKQKLQKLEEIVKGPFFNGEDFYIIDASVAPGFDQMDLVEQRYKVAFFEKVPNVTKWKDTLLADNEVKKSVVDNFEDLFDAYLRKYDKSYLNTLRIKDRF